MKKNSPTGYIPYDIHGNGCIHQNRDEMGRLLPPCGLNTLKDAQSGWLCQVHDRLLFKKTAVSPTP